MHIVAFTGHYFPYMAPPVRCVNPYLESLAEDHELDIICPIYDRRYKNNFIKGKIKLNFVDSLSNKFKSYIQTNRETKKYRFWNGILFWMYRATRYFFSWLKRDALEDSTLANSLLNQAKAINRNSKIDVIISVSFPFYSHVAAYKYKRCHPDVRWVTFTTDPFAYSESNPIVGYKKSRAILTELRIYENSDYCIVTEELYPNLIDDFKISPSKILKLPFLLTNQPSEDNSGESPNEINVLYAGYLYYKIRNPKLMMESFSHIDNMKFNLYVAGDRHCRKYFDREFPSNIHINGLVPREKYLEILTWNDVFINLSNTIRLQAPSKLLELISTGKPVINFYHYQDSGYHIVDMYPLGLNISCELDIADIVEQMKLFINQNAKKRIDYAEIREIFSDHLLENQLPKVRKVLLGIA